MTRRLLFPRLTKNGENHAVCHRVHGPGDRVRRGRPYRRRDSRKDEVAALTEAQKRAQENYRKKSVKQISVRFYPDTMDLYEWVRSQENGQVYIKDLIRADMEKRRHEDDKSWRAD